MVITEDEEFELVKHERKFKLDSTRTAMVSHEYYWIPVDPSTPTGVKILMLGRGGVASLGQYRHRPNETQFWTHWAPLPRKRA
jgi:hypothetical protein